MIQQLKSMSTHVLFQMFKKYSSEGNYAKILMIKDEMKARAKTCLISVEEQPEHKAIKVNFIRDKHGNMMDFTSEGIKKYFRELEHSVCFNSYENVFERKKSNLHDAIKVQSKRIDRLEFQFSHFNF